MRPTALSWGTDVCGICGIVYKDSSREVDPALVHRMTDVLAHRGPDDSGAYFHGSVGLGHRRLSIVDLASGHQPLPNEDRSVWIVFNGEVYNHASLRPALERAGHVYRTRCDTETILHAYEEHGPASLDLLRGMFAFAIYDEQSGALSLARDRLGIKPLYYIDTPELFAFASEVKALLELPSLRAEVDMDALLQVLAVRYTMDDSTLFRGIKALPPGHLLELRQGRIEVQRYYDFSEIQQDDSLTESAAISRFRDLFDESVRLRLMADVPLGVFLSGGLDSSVIAARMAKMVDRPISTFSVAFGEREANELEYSRLVADHIGAHRHEVTMSPQDFFDLWPRMVYQEDEPLAFSSSMALYVVAKLAKQHVKVVLTGEGSDELLAGYDRYYQTVYNLKASGMFPDALRRALSRPLLNALPGGFPYRNKARRTFLYLEGNVESLFLDNYSIFSRELLSDWGTPTLLNGRDPSQVYAPFLGFFDRSRQFSRLGKLLYADVNTYLLELLMRQDQMSMAASLESRVPFLDHELVEFAFSLPDHLKLKGFDTKRILRLAFGDQLPHQILTRAKQGFPVPTRRWFQGEYHTAMRSLVLGDDSFCTEILDRGQLTRMFDEHRNGTMNHVDRIWSLANIELWHRIFIQGRTPESIELRPSARAGRLA